MSTKSTVYYDAERDVHLYQDGFDCWNLYLDLPAQRSGLRSEETIVIPLAVWKELRQHTIDMERYLGMSPGELLAEARQQVHERIQGWEDAPENLKSVRALSGCASYGWTRPDALFEEQVEGYIRWHTPPSDEEAPA